MKLFLIVSTYDRFNSLGKLVQSIRSRYNQEWKICVVGQEYKRKEIKVIENHVDDFLDLRARIGPHSARVKGLKKWKADFYCNLDDDMELIPETNYEGAIEKIKSSPDIGMVSGNWVQYDSMLKKKILNMEEKFIPQPLVFTGGGLVYPDRVADLIREYPDKPYMFDDMLWAGVAYVAGYKNYRYLNSLAIHRILSPGGRSGWVDLANRELPDSRYIKITRMKNFGEERGKRDNNYLIPKGNDITEEAKRLHLENNRKINSL